MLDTFTFLHVENIITVLQLIILRFSENSEVHSSFCCQQRSYRPAKPEVGMRRLCCPFLPCQCGQLVIVSTQQHVLGTVLVQVTVILMIICEMWHFDNDTFGISVVRGEWGATQPFPSVGGVSLMEGFELYLSGICDPPANPPSCKSIIY